MGLNKRSTRKYDSIVYNLKNVKELSEVVKDSILEVLTSIVDYFELRDSLKDGICITDISLRDVGESFRLKVCGYAGPSVNEDGNSNDLEECSVTVYLKPTDLSILIGDLQKAEVTVSGGLYPYDGDIGVNLVPDASIKETIEWCIAALENYGKPVMGIDFHVTGINETSYSVDYEKPFTEIHTEVDWNREEHFGASAEAWIDVKLALNDVEAEEAIKKGDFVFGTHVVKEKETDDKTAVGAEYLYIELKG